MHTLFGVEMQLRYLKLLLQNNKELQALLFSIIKDRAPLI